jgi:hypothetical protein
MTVVLLLGWQFSNDSCESAAERLIRLAAAA